MVTPVRRRSRATGSVRRGWTSPARRPVITSSRHAPPTWAASRSRSAVVRSQLAGDPDQPVEHPLAGGAQPVVLVLVGDPGVDPGEQGGGAQRHLAVDEGVVVVDARRDRDVGLPQRLLVVEPRPRVLGQDLGQPGVRAQLGEVLEVPREDVLAGQQRLVLVVRRRPDPVRRPAGSPGRRRSTTRAGTCRSGCGRRTAAGRRRRARTPARSGRARAGGAAARRRRPCRACCRPSAAAAASAGRRSGSRSAPARARSSAARIRSRSPGNRR